jgi:hypothetical protein
MTQLFPDLDDDARLWVWIAERPLTGEDASAVRGAIEAFLSSWTTHGRSIRGDAAILYDQVLVLAGEVSEGEISGCGIDKSARLLESAGREHGFEWSSGLSVPVLATVSGPVRMLTRAELRREASGGRITPEQLLIDRAITRLGDARRGMLCRPVRDTWAARYVPASETG